MVKCGCENCGSEFNSYEELEKHDCSKKFPCAVCPMGYYKIEDLVSHTEKEHPHIHTCGHCDYACQTIQDMDAHLKKCAGMALDKILQQPPAFQATGEYTKPPKYSHEDTINPPHYMALDAYCSNNDCQQPIECIDVTRHMNFNLGNVVKYIWRSDHKGDRQEQLKKAHWYLRDEIRKQEPDFDAND